MAEKTQLRERYELREVLGRGGMGIVYRAWDQLMKREVAVKTLLEVDNPVSLNLFFKEWGLLASMVHPNIISIYDIGEFEQNGIVRPFFVMPLLVGSSLDKLIRDGSPKHDTSRMIEIVVQASRGLQAAHDMGLIHRDVKPSNIFVLDDESVKIIDFGIARSASSATKTGLKGTLSYIAPEQLQLKPPTPLGDQYSLAVVCYQALTRTLPYRGTSESEVTHAILHHSAAPVSEVNGSVNYMVSKTIHKGMARSAWHRFPNVREFGESLLKAQRGETISYFDISQIKPRLQKAIESFERGEYDFAADILGELEGEGHLDQQIVLVRRQVEQAIRQKRLRVLLDNARRFQEAQEYSVALRKVQEALDLDPQDTDSLALKSAIEKDRREKKIVEWNQIARQHIANESYQQAREALNNILRAKPHDAEALQMVAEITREEQELERRRERKSALYSQAMQAWERGEVTSALSKLEVLANLEQERPDNDSGMSATFESFYNQVRSEHDQLKNQYAEARRLLSDDDFAGARGLCRQMLAKYPNHALFQALDYDIRERQSQKLSAYIAETDRRVEQEPDLDRRVSLLEEALRNYPAETHFEQTLRLVREKRDLLSSIVMKGRYFEEQHHFNEALDQWHIVRSIHPEYPGLAFELERLAKRRDQHALESSKATWIEQVETSLETGNYAAAARHVISALAEFPDDAELIELGRLARNRDELGTQAAALAAQAQVHLEANQLADALPLLREASTLDPLSSAVQSMLINTLLEQARALVDTDPDAAAAMVQEVFVLKPNHPAAASLAAQLKHARTEEELSWCLAEARRLQADGDAQGALAIVEPFLNRYPNEPRLQQLRSSLERSRAEKLKLQSAQQTRTTAPPFKTKATMTALATEPPPPPLPPVPPPIPPPDLEPPPMPPTLELAPVKSHRALKAGLIGVAVLVLLVVTGAAWFALSKPKPVPPAPVVAPVALVSVDITATPATAEVRIDGTTCGAGHCALPLSPGTHKIDATLAGYFPASQSIQIAAGPGVSVPPIRLTLTEASPLLAVTTNLTDGQYALDQNPPAKIGGAEFALKNIADGPHTLRIFGGASEAIITATFATGQAPQLKLPLLTRAFRVGVVSSRGDAAKVYFSAPGATAALDGQPAVPLPPSGLDLNDLSPGRHEVAIDVPGVGSGLIVFDASPAPTLTIAATADVALAGLRLMSNEDGATVFLNNSPLNLQPRRGQLMLYLAPKTYAVRLEKTGYATPPEQIVQLKRGQETKLQFQLLPAARQSALTFRNGPPGSEVAIDGHRIGTIAADGRLATSVDPGRHRIEISKPGYRPLTLEQDFAPGKPVDIPAFLVGATGALRVVVQPASAKAQLELQRDGDPQRRPATDLNADLAEGTYTVFANAPGFRPHSATIIVKAGQTAVATIPLDPLNLAPPKPAPAQSPGLADWERAGGWERTAQGLTRQGGEWLFLPNGLTSTIRFRIAVVKGKAAEWALVANEANRVDYRLDKAALERQETIGGKRGPKIRIALNTKLEEPTDVVIRLTGNALETTAQNASGRAADNLVSAVTSYASARFGLHIPRRDSVQLFDFFMK